MSNKHYVGLDLTDFEDNGKARPISKVTLMLDANNELSAGDNSGYELKADCPHATQEMADSILAKIKGYQYQMYTAGAANIDPAAELGDGITAGGVYGVLAHISDSGGYPDLTAPAQTELDDEFPSVGPGTKEIERKFSQTYTHITETAEQIKSEVKSDMDIQSGSFTEQLGKVKTELNGNISNLSTEVTEKNKTLETKIDDSISNVSSSFDTKLNGVSSKLDTLESNTRSSLNTLSQNQSTISRDLSGFKSTVSQTYSTKTELGNQVKTLTSAITQTASSIKTEVSETYATKKGLSDEVTTLKSTITQTATSIKTEVSATYATKSALSEEVKTLQSSITQTATSIETKVSETYATKKGLSEEVKTLQSSISQTATSIETKVSKTYATQSSLKTEISTIKQYVDSISLSVSNGTDSSTLTLKAGSTTLNSASIKFTGVVTVAGLKDGSTTIDGGCIKTGTISANRIDVKDLKVQTVYTSAGYTAFSTSGSTLNIGGTAWTPSHVKIYGSSSVFIGETSTTGITFDTSSRTVTFGSSLSPWVLGSASKPLSSIATSTLVVSSNAKFSGKIGFFDTTPISKMGLNYSSATPNNYLSIINRFITIFKAYGLIYV